MPDAFVCVVGNLVRDPELRFTAAGYENCQLTVAVGRRWVDKATGEERDETSFFDVECWGELAENVSESLRKGHRVTVEGRLRQRSWLDKDEVRHYRVDVVADDVAVSLRWARAKVAKVVRDEPTGAVGNGAAPVVAA